MIQDDITDNEFDWITFKVKGDALFTKITQIIIKNGQFLRIKNKKKKK